MTDRLSTASPGEVPTDSQRQAMASPPGTSAKKPSRRAAVRQHDLTRVLRAARSAGLKVIGYEVDPATGKITVNTDVSKERNDPEADLTWWLQRYGNKIYQK
jgi:hypothetical protein